MIMESYILVWDMLHKNMRAKKEKRANGRKAVQKMWHGLQVRCFENWHQVYCTKKRERESQTVEQVSREAAQRACAGGSQESHCRYATPVGPYCACRPEREARYSDWPGDGGTLHSIHLAPVAHWETLASGQRSGLRGKG